MHKYENTGTGNYHGFWVWNMVNSATIRSRGGVDEFRLPD